MVTFKPSPPTSGRRAKRQSPTRDEFHAKPESLLMHGRAAADRPVPPLAEGSMQELKWKAQPQQDPSKGSGNGAIAKWELRKLDTWNPSGPDPNKTKDPTGKGTFSAFDPKGGAGRETGMALPGARDTWRPTHGRRAAAPPQQAAEQPVWSPNSFFPEGLHELKGATRPPHPFNLTTDYGDALVQQPSAEERRKRESQLNALRVLRTKIEQSCRMNGRTITDVESMFDAMDKDGSGGMDYAEFTQGLKALGIVFGPKQLDAVLEALDANGDGQVTISEFVAQCDDRYRDDGALGELDAEMHERAGGLKAKKKAKSNVFGETMNLTLAADIALRNRYTKAGGASRFRLAAKQQVLSPANDICSHVLVCIQLRVFCKQDAISRVHTFTRCLAEQVQPVSPIAVVAIDRIFAFIKKEQLKVIDMFFKIDADGSGEIEPAEFVQAISKMGLKLSPEELDAVVYELDVDGDGTVELHEYM
eukprot:COSAG02_NODE_6234_length_3707_cov_3.105044_1_plen_475_part_00